MGTEIEHKYLVKDESYISMQESEYPIIQGYLCREPDRVVRIRLMGEEGFITVKGKTNGCERLEFEYEIPKNDAEQLISLCEGRILKKIRHIVFYRGNKWEVDEFCGDLCGMKIAEIEIPFADYQYELPPFAGENVTGCAEYYNSNL